MNKIVSTVLSLSFTALAMNAFAETAPTEAAPMEAAQTEAAPAAMQTEKQEIQNASAMAEEGFSKLDANKDGVIDRKEAKADKNLSKAFKKIAKKGKLDQEGYDKWAKAQAAKTKG